jgi:hypothetical protein
LRAFTGVIGVIVAALVTIGAMAGCASNPAAKLLPGVSHDPPQPKIGISDRSFSMRSDVFSVELETFCAAGATLTSARCSCIGRARESASFGGVSKTRTAMCI